jgi:hypothetical protein
MPELLDSKCALNFQYEDYSSDLIISITSSLIQFITAKGRESGVGALSICPPPLLPRPTIYAQGEKSNIVTEVGSLVRFVLTFGRNLAFRNLALGFTEYYSPDETQRSLLQICQSFMIMPRGYLQSPF